MEFKIFGINVLRYVDVVVVRRAGPGKFSAARSRQPEGWLSSATLTVRSKLRGAHNNSMRETEREREGDRREEGSIRAAKKKVKLRSHRSKSVRREQHDGEPSL